MRILITNSVPLNGGDEALLRALILSLKLKYENPRIHVLCMNLQLCRKNLTDIDFESDLEFTDKKVNRITRKLREFLQEKLNFTNNSPLIRLLLNRSERITRKLYDKADIIISSPGGFLHDFYPVDDRLSGFNYAITKGKRVILCGQSIGPFWKKETILKVSSVFKNLFRIYVRDNTSYENLRSIGFSCDNVIVTTDMAFLWRNLRPDLFKPKKGFLKKIVVNFREWNYENANMDLLFHNAVKLCNLILRDESKEIYFLSTCQGIREYVDDSILAERIVNQIDVNYRKRIQVDKNRYSTEKLISKFGEFDAFIGMRLHGAILAMLGGTISMGLGYEEKTRGIFTQLGFEKYQVDSFSDFEEWEITYRYFLNDFEEVRNRLPKALDKLAVMASKNLDF
ncbi:MAG: polysaccharide pyruvyl transferase family protein [Bacteroidota bacterium]